MKEQPMHTTQKELDIEAPFPGWIMPVTIYIYGASGMLRHHRRLDPPGPHSVSRLVGETALIHRIPPSNVSIDRWDADKRRLHVNIR
ncbi:MAG: hypothetical protein V4486_01160 [Patescibacteria group bacterium]